MDAPLRAPSLAGTPMDHYFHACALVRGRKEERQVLGPFFREAIEWGEKVVHITDPEQEDDDREQLRGFGIDVRAAEMRGQLRVMSWHDMYLLGGRFDAERMLSTLEEAIEAGRASGYRRTRFAGLIGRAVEDRPAEQVIEYEVLVNEVLLRNRHPGVCVYDIDRMSGAMVMDILRTHPLTVVGGVLQENPLFTPPEQFLRELRLRRSGRRDGVYAA